MRLRRFSIALYVVFVLLLVAQSTWWVIYLGRESENFRHYYMQRLKTEQFHAAYLLQLNPELGEDPVASLGESFPGLIFQPGEDGVDVLINPDAQAAVLEEDARRKRMFFWEGSFFLVVLLGGLGLVTAAFIREARFKRARELFLSGVTHEFKTPLASLSLYTETLARPELDASQRGGILERMQEDLVRLETMVEQVLAVARTGARRVRKDESLEVRREIDAALSGMEMLVERSGAHLTVLGGERCRARGDREALRVALRNLVGNALQHGSEGVAITVAVACAADRCEIMVEDDGPGIPSKEHEQVFRSFYRVGEASPDHPRSKGTGLGLHLVRRNVEAMGGKVRLDSAPGKGTRLTLSLPADERRPGAEESSE